MSKNPIMEIEKELEGFPLEDRARLGEDFVLYLRQLQEIRQELDIAERDVEAGRISRVSDLDRVIQELRRQYAGV